MKGYLLNSLIIFILLAVAVLFIVLYVSLLNSKKLCKGDVHHCPNADVDICVKTGTDKKDWKNMCVKLSSHGYNPNPTKLSRDINLKQNNPQLIAQDMSNICGKYISPYSKAVKCAIKLSKFENDKYMQNGPLFGNSTGIADDMDQNRWCLGMSTKGRQNYEIPLEIERGKC
jgi:hypothetical protein